jgi:hypothetical protein
MNDNARVPTAEEEILAAHKVADLLGARRTHEVDGQTLVLTLQARVIECFFLGLKARHQIEQAGSAAYPSSQSVEFDAKTPQA